MCNNDWMECDCEDCAIKMQDALDKWEVEAPQREEQRREELDSQGYYDNPEGWFANYGRRS